MTMEEQIRNRFTKVTNYLNRLKRDDDEFDVDQPVIAEVLELERETTQKAAKVLRVDAYHDHLLSYVQSERELFLEDDDDGLSRSEPLCTCSDGYCDLKRGQLPTRVREADDLDAGIREFKQRHNGYPRVLDEAQEQRDAHMAEVYNDLGRILYALSSNTRISDMQLDDANDVDTASAA